MFEASFYFAQQRIENCVSPSLKWIIDHIKYRNDSNCNYFSYVNIFYHDETRKIKFKITLTKETLDTTKNYNGLLITINKIFSENIQNYLENNRSV